MIDPNFVETTNFLDVHTLHTYTAAMLNADQNGLSKKIPLGGAMRTRISSQCLKYRWRNAHSEYALQGIEGFTEAVRSRNIVERQVMEQIRQECACGDDVLDAVELGFNVGVYGKNGGTEPGRQPLVMGYPEVEYLRAKAREICESNPNDVKAAQDALARFFHDRYGHGKNFKGLLDGTRLPYGLLTALFGRMITSDPGANIDGAIHVGHAHTTHQMEIEQDYFSVVDDLQRYYEDGGAAHISNNELASGIYYGHVVVDVAELVSNLEGIDSKLWLSADRDMTAEVVRRLIHLIATVSPGAKKGSTAPYGYSELMVISAGSRQPCSMTEAFRDAVEPQVKDSVEALAKKMSGFDRAYGHNPRKFISAGDYEIPGADRCDDLLHLVDWVGETIREGQVK